MSQARRTELTFSRAFDENKVSSSVEFERLRSEVEHEISTTSSHEYSPSKLTGRPLDALLLDLCAGQFSDEKLWIAIPLNSGWYSGTSRYRPERIGYRPTKKLLDALERGSLIEVAPGYANRAAGIGYRTRIRATEKLRILITKHGFKREHISVVPELDCIRLRDSDKKLVDYCDTCTTNTMRTNLKGINAFNKKHSFTLDMTEEEWEALRETLRIKTVETGRPAVLDLGRVEQHRVFNQSSFKKGGRFYGGWWQGLPETYRKKIRIDGKVTSEIDYSSIQPVLLYGKENITLSDDPYLVPGLGHKSRKEAKLIWNIVINADSRDEALGAINAEMIGRPLPEGFETWEDVTDEVARHHKVIEKYFYTGYGRELQYMDSQIAEAVMLELQAKGIPVLPVHDSFIVSKDNEGDLKEAMIRVFEEKVGIEPSVTIRMFLAALQ